MSKITVNSSAKELLESALKDIREKRKVIAGLGHIEQKIRNAIVILEKEKRNNDMMSEWLEKLGTDD